MKWIIMLTVYLSFFIPSAISQRNSVQISKNKTNKVSKIDHKLQLTPTQNEKVVQIREDAKKKIHIINEDRKLAPTEREVKVRQVVKDAQLKKMEVLTPAQQKIFSEELKQRN